MVGRAESPMSREPEFLVAAVRRFLHPGTALPNAEDLDWQHVLRLASAHAVTPMVYSALREAALGIPEPIAADLRSAFEASVRWSLALGAELSGVAGLLEEQGIVAIAIKGPLLSEYLYGKLGARSSGDVDLLVKRSDVLRIRKALVPKGYRVMNTLHWNADSACLRSRENEISFEGPSGVSIDVHWRALPAYFASPFDDIDVWQHLSTTSLAGRKVSTLPPEHIFFLLCSHSAKHGFERLGWICDIARFVMVTPGLDWPAIVAKAERTRTLRQVLVSLRLAEDVLGVPYPLDLKLDGKGERLVSAVKSRLLAGAEPPTPHSELFRFCLELFETRWHQLRFMAGHFSPSQAEHMALKLPPSLYFLYYPFRPIRLFAKQLRRKNP